MVGSAETAGGVRHLFLSTDQSGMALIDVVGGLPGPLYRNNQSKINDSGEICGLRIDHFDGIHGEAYVLTPLP